MRHQSRVMVFLGVGLAAVFIWSLVRPHDYFTWLLEVLPAIIGVAVLAATYQRFRFSTLVYILICLHATILMIGGHYTYAEVPLFNWIRDVFGFSRNHYDRLGHFAQGFVPAMIAREILLRTTPLRRGKMLFYLIVSICLAISALYEICEWRAAVTFGDSATAFLGTQGDPWDTQWDMTFALIGAITALVTMPRLHDRSMREIEAIPQ